MDDKEAAELLKAENEALQAEIAALRQQVHGLEHQAAFQNLFERSADAHFLVDIESGQFTECNSTFLHLLGYTNKEQITSLHPHEISPEHQPDGHTSAELARARLETTMREGHITFEWHHQRLNGEIFPVEVTLNLCLYNNKNAIYGNWRDITSRKQTEEQLRIIEERYRSLYENVPLGFFRTNISDGGFLTTNPAMADLCGYESPEELMEHRPSARLLYANPDQRNEVLHKLQSNKGRVQTEIQYRYRDERTLDARLSLWVVRDEHDEPRYLEGFLEDITAQKEAEAERMAFKEQIIQAQRAALRELSTPLIPLSQNVVLIPLIGTIDSNRAQQVMETLLEGIAAYQADTAIVDITGVSVVDTQVANALIQAAQAVRLLGAQVILTGIGPSMAQTLVHLGADLSSITTRGSLQSAVLEALRLARV
jgi:rsbT co-antagonist protein RsbR